MLPPLPPQHPPPLFLSSFQLSPYLTFLSLLFPSPFLFPHHHLPSLHLPLSSMLPLLFPSIHLTSFFFPLSPMTLLLCLSIHLPSLLLPLSSPPPLLFPSGQMGQFTTYERGRNLAATMAEGLADETLFDPPPAATTLMPHPPHRHTLQEW